MKVFKYLFISILPITVFFAFTNRGWVTILPMITFFGLVPLLELFFSPNKENFTKEEEQTEKISGISQLETALYRTLQTIT